jgi:formate dehydrogenase major subunit
MTPLDRRAFLRRSAAGFSLGGLLGLGLDVRAARAEAGRLAFARIREVPSVCPYCAVGCGQLVGVKDGKIVNVEGNPDSPINRGTLCPKGAASYQLAVNDLRAQKVLYRAPGASAWEEKSLAWAMDQIAQRVKATRDATFREFADTDLEGNKLPKAKRVNHTLAIASLGGATMDNEWNYVQAKLLRGLGVVAIENQARI